MLENPWSAVGNPTSALGRSSLAPLGIHHLVLSNLATAAAAAAEGFYIISF